MRYAEMKGYRPADSNPVDSVPNMSVSARDQYIGDSKLRRIKRAALVGADGKRTRSGPMICCLIVVAPYIADKGLYFKPSKTADSTGAKVVIGWTPRLLAVVERIKKSADRPCAG
jgi:hypothetical protein